MIRRAIILTTLLFFGFETFSQQRVHADFDKHYASALKIGRVNRERMRTILDTLTMLASSKQDTIRLLSLEAMLNNPVNKSLGLSQIDEAQRMGDCARIHEYDHILAYVKGVLLKGLHHDSASYYLNKSLGLAQPRKDSLIISECFTVLSYLEMERGNFVKAWRNLESSQVYFKEGEFRSIVINHTNQSHALSSIGLEERAIALAQQGIEFAKSHPYPDHQSDLLPLYGNLIESHLKLNQPREAFQYVTEARHVFRDLDSLNLSNPAFLLSVGDCYLALDSPSRALEVYKLSSINPDHKTWHFRKLKGLFEAYRRVNDLANSRIIAREITKHVPALPGVKDRMEIFKMAEDAFSFLDMQDSADHYYRLHVDNYKQLYNQTQVAEILQDEFKGELDRARETAQLQALILESKIRLGKQQVVFLLMGAILLGVVALLLIIRYRSIKKFNALLDRKIQERTAELVAKNKQLSEYAFINAHKVRGPLARILGLTNLVSGQHELGEVIKLNELVKKESESLDSIVRSITEAVEEKRVFDRNDVV
jgi:hypothetical protein